MRAPASGDLSRTALAAYVAEHLAAPARAILGFQELIAEQAREAGRDDLLPDLEKVSGAAGSLDRLIRALIGKGHEEVGELPEEAEARLRHDLRTPLNAILGYSEMVAEDIDPAHDGLRRDLNVVLAEARALLGKIDDIVDLVRTNTAVAPEGKAGDVAASLAATLRRPSFDTAAPEAGVILVVDDVASNRDLLARRLGGAGHTVLQAESGAAALAVLSSRAVDLILLDVMMPDMNGIELLARLRGEPATARLPVIMVSGLDQSAAVIRCIEAGADDYLVKPFNPILLSARINACLERKRWADRESRYLRQIELEKSRADTLLRSILPDQIVTRLAAGETVIADRFEAATILFADIVGFTPIAALMPAPELVRRLDQVFRSFDALALEWGVEKIKTVGDAYMAVAGLPAPCPDHADRILQFARAMLASLDEADPGGDPFQLRIGVHSGPVVAGLIGAHRFVYDVWGETVNIASRLESQGEPNTIHLSGATHAALTNCSMCISLGEVRLRGIGFVSTYRVASTAATKHAKD